MNGGQSARRRGSRRLRLLTSALLVLALLPMLGGKAGAVEGGDTAPLGLRASGGAIDLVFAIDTTGSMGGSIAAVRTELAQITDAVLGSGFSGRIGITEYRDDVDAFQARQVVGLTDDLSAITAGIGSLGAAGGGDIPESVYSGVMTALEEPWRPEAVKAIIVMGDAPGHDPEPVTGYTLESTLAAAAAAPASVVVSGPSRALARSATDGVRIHSAVIGSNSSTLAWFKALADGSGGSVVEIGGADGVVEGLLRLIDDIKDDVEPPVDEPPVEEPPVDEPVDDAPATDAAIVAFVKAAYEDFLGRAPTDVELETTVTALADGSLTRAEFVSGLAHSDAWISAIVDRFYEDTLGRPGDDPGVDYWTEQLGSGARPVSEVFSFFYASSEYYEGIGGGTPSTWVADLYAKLLERVPDPSGAGFWADRAEMDRMSVALPFFQSIESRTKRVAALYESMLGRSADADGLTHWAEQILTGGDIVLAADLASSDEYFERASKRFG